MAEFVLQLLEQFPRSTAFREERAFAGAWQHWRKKFKGRGGWEERWNTLRNSPGQSKLDSLARSTCYATSQLAADMHVVIQRQVRRQYWKNTSIRSRTCSKSSAESRRRFSTKRKTGEKLSRRVVSGFDRMLDVMSSRQSPHIASLLNQLTGLPRAVNSSTRF